MLRSIDRELFQLVGTMSTADSSVGGIIEHGTTLPVHANSLELLRELLEGDFSEDVTKNVIDKLISKATTDVITDMELVIDTLNLGASVDKSALYGLEYYGISEFEHALVYLLTLVDHSVLMQEKVDLKSVITIVHPVGFYTTQTCDVIIEKIINGGKAEQGHLYHKALEIRH